MFLITKLKYYYGIRKNNIFEKIFYRIFTIIYYSFFVIFIFGLSFLPVILEGKFANITSSLTEQQQDFIITNAISIFGITITVFSILTSLKSYKIYRESELKLILKTNLFYVFSINWALFMTIFYLMGLIITYSTGGNATNIALSLTIYSYILICFCIYALKLKKSYIYYKNNNLNVLYNPYFRIIGNIFNYIGGERKPEKIKDNLKDNALVQTYSFLETLQEYTFYNNNIDEEVCIDSFKIYIKKHRKKIKTDVQMSIVSDISKFIEAIIRNLVNTKNYFAAINICNIYLEEYIKLIESKKFKKRIVFLSKQEYDRIACYKNGELLLFCMTRNALIINDLLTSKIVFENISEFIEETNNSKFFLENDISIMKNRIIKINNQIDEINSKLKKDIELLKENGEQKK